MAHGIRVLRPSRKSELISSVFFDEHFARNLAPDVNICTVPLREWCQSFLGAPEHPFSLKEAAKRFASETKGFPFLCPSYEGLPLTPLFLALRNRTGAKIRLLFIAHAPGSYATEWALLAPLLVPGDLIIAPSRSARVTIEFLCSDLSPFIRVIHHPMHPLPRLRAGKKNCIVSLTRMDPQKLIHRQIEAMDILRRRHVPLPRMQIAGPLKDNASGDFHSYARSLLAKIRRLGLEKNVELLDSIRGDLHKAEFLSRADLLIQLSVTVEEAFPKSSVEALGAGVPVVATRWDGFVETVGSCGELVPVSDVGNGLAVDVSPEDIADAVERILANPPSPEMCHTQASRFTPETIRRRYREVLEEASESSSDAVHQIHPFENDDRIAAPQGGLLSITAPLTVLSRKELFEFHMEESSSMRKAWEGENPSQISRGERLRSLLCEGTRKALERFLGGLDYQRFIQVTRAETARVSFHDPFISGIASALCSKATQTSRQLCLLALKEQGQTELFLKGLERLQREEIRSAGIEYFIIEAEQLRGNYPNAFDLCIQKNDPDLWGEFAALRLRQLARICREWNRPELALPRLREWLEKYPDSPDSGTVWLDLCVNALYAGKEYLSESFKALERASDLLGNLPVIEKVRHALGIELLS